MTESLWLAVPRTQHMQSFQSLLTGPRHEKVYRLNYFSGNTLMEVDKYLGELTPTFMLVLVFTDILLAEMVTHELESSAVTSNAQCMHTLQTQPFNPMPKHTCV